MVDSKNPQQAERAKQMYYFDRKLSTLEVIIRALLDINRPESPIVREKIQQAEDIILTIPLEFGSFLEGWFLKLSDWWLEFDHQFERKEITRREVLSKRTHIPGTYYDWD